MLLLPLATRGNYSPPPAGPRERVKKVGFFLGPSLLPPSPNPPLFFWPPAWIIQCAVKRRWSTVGESPTRELVRSTR